MYKGYELLTDKEREHLDKVAGVKDDAGLVKNFTGQAAMRRANKNVPPDRAPEPCWTCKFIAKKLGYEV